KGARLTDGGRLAIGGALAVEHTKLPAERVARFLDTVAYPQRSAVALVLGWVNDEFAWLRRGPVRRTIPRGDRRCRCRDERLGRGQCITGRLGGDHRRRHRHRLRTG